MCWWVGVGIVCSIFVEEASGGGGRWLRRCRVVLELWVTTVCYC